MKSRVSDLSRQRMIQHKAAMTPVMAAHAGVHRCQMPAKATAQDTTLLIVTKIDVISIWSPTRANT